MHKAASSWLVAALIAAAPPAAIAGPPYVSDDPGPTDMGHFEIYLFNKVVAARGDVAGASGIDFNYGAAPDLQLTAVLPIAYDSPSVGSQVGGIGNVELAAKYRFLHQDDIGWSVAVFPRLFLPSASPLVGDKHFSLLLPVWIGREWGRWSTFGGGGCEINRGGGAQDFCLLGWALTREVSPALTLGAEVVHQTANSKGGRASTALDVGLTYDASDTYHLLASFGPGLQNAGVTGRYSWYASLLVTF